MYAFDNVDNSGCLLMKLLFQERDNMTELLGKQHEMERNELTHHLKLEQDEEVEKLRKV